MRKYITALFGILLGTWMIMIYFPENERLVKIGFVLGCIFFLLGLVNLWSAFSKK